MSTCHAGAAIRNGRDFQPILLEKALPFAEIGGRIVGGAMAILGVAGLVLALT